VGIVETNGRGYRLLHFGAIRPVASQPFASRLAHIYRELARLVERFQPHSVAVEQVFQARNVKSALQLSQVRGVVQLAAAMAGLPVSEYSALSVKKSVVGYGQAEKRQVPDVGKALAHSWGATIGFHTLMVLGSQSP